MIMVIQFKKKISMFYGTLRFITLFRQSMARKQSQAHAEHNYSLMCDGPCIIVITVE